MGIVAKGLIKEFGIPPTQVLHGIDLTIDDGDFLSISGRSGSGKSTLLYLISTLDTPTRGSVLIDNHDPATMPINDLHLYRCQHIGFIFQFHYLLPELNALENILLPARNLGKIRDYEQRALDLLEQMEVTEQAYKFPGQMSGGQQQRVAIARSLILRPRYIFADEPTGNLDTYNSQKVMNILANINMDDKTTIILVTHEPDYASRAKREIVLKDGIIEKSLHF